MGRRLGTGFEKQIQDRYACLGPTANSGAKFGDADLRHRAGRFIVECKDRGTDGISIPGGDLKKMELQALRYGEGNWIRFSRNRTGKIVVSMNDSLFDLLLATWEREDR